MQACITSPPYWGLRDYGTEPQTWPDGWVGHLGLEPTPELYVAHLVEVFREVRRVLRDDGTLWLNLGDSYAASPRGNRPGDHSTSSLTNPDRQDQLRRGARRVKAPGLKHKDLVGIPWLVAFALRDDGWYLRMDNVWAKSVSGQKELTRILTEALRKAGLSHDAVHRTMAHLEPYVGTCMPESVRDRTTRSHEYVFVLTKSPKYFYDGHSVMEGAVGVDRVRADRFGSNKHGNATTKHSDGSTFVHSATRNRRSVWMIPPRPFKGAHFAVFPPHLVEPCLLAATPEYGSCGACGAPYKRQVRKRKDDPALDAHKRACGADSTGGYSGTAQKDYAPHLAQDPSAVKARILEGMAVKETLGWEPTCTCAADVVPSVVLDPFGGSGTVLAVAELYGRRAISIELNPDYANLREMRRKDVQRALRRAVPVVQSRQPRRPHQAAMSPRTTPCW